MSCQPFSIGPLRIDPPVLSAPMAGCTNFAWRMLLRSLGGVGLIATEMVSARSFVYMDAEGDDLPARLWGVDSEPRPLAVQIWDNIPESLAETADRLAHEYKVSVVDLNFGCPAPRIVAKSTSGSWLLRDPDRIGQLVARVVQAASPVPVTAKIRIGLTSDTINAIDVAQAVEDAGASALTVHGRTTRQMYSGEADWDEIARIKPYLKRIPLIGNGDIRTWETALQRLTHFPVDGIMIGRGGFDRPWIFRQIQQALRGETPDPDPSLEQRKQILFDLYRFVRTRLDPEPAVVLIRRFACYFSKNLPGGRTFRDQVCRLTRENDFIDLVQNFG